MCTFFISPIDGEREKKACRQRHIFHFFSLLIIDKQSNNSDFRAVFIIFTLCVCCYWMRTQQKTQITMNNEFNSLVNSGNEVYHQASRRALFMFGTLKPTSIECSLQSTGLITICTIFSNYFRNYLTSSGRQRVTETEENPRAKLKLLKMS